MTQNLPIEGQMRYLCEAGARISELKNRVKNTKHWVGRRQPKYADEELLHLINEAQKMRLHLKAWDNYVMPPTNRATP